MLWLFSLYLLYESCNCIRSLQVAEEAAVQMLH